MYKKFYLYVDGSCKGNPGKGGFAYRSYDENGNIWTDGRGVHENTTNNQMELYAAIEGLKSLKNNYDNFEVEVYSDSAYVVNCFRDGWAIKWNNNGWKNEKNEDVKNKEYWEELLQLSADTNAMFIKVSRDDKKLKEVDAIARRYCN